VEVIEPATFTRPAVWRRFDDLPVEPATYSTFADSRWAAAPAVKTVHLFRGRPDDEDPSRFLIPYDLDGRPGVVAGRLHSDGTVTLIVAGGPDLSRCYVRHVNVPPDDNSGQFMLPSDDLNGF
jgi:hypothetical protein